MQKRKLKKLAGSGASDDAEYQDVVRLAEIDPLVPVSYDVIKNAVDPQDDFDAEQLADYLGIASFQFANGPAHAAA